MRSAESGIAFGALRPSVPRRGCEECRCAARSNLRSPRPSGARRNDFDAGVHPPGDPGDTFLVGWLVETYPYVECKIPSIKKNWLCCDTQQPCFSGYYRRVKKTLARLPAPRNLLAWYEELIQARRAAPGRAPRARARARAPVGIFFWSQPLRAARARAGHARSPRMSSPVGSSLPRLLLCPPCPPSPRARAVPRAGSIFFWSQPARPPWRSGGVLPRGRPHTRSTHRPPLPPLPPLSPSPPPRRARVARRRPRSRGLRLGAAPGPGAMGSMDSALLCMLNP